MCMRVYVCAFVCKNMSIDEAVTHMLILSGVIGVCVCIFGQQMQHACKLQYSTIHTCGATLYLRQCS
jgi:ribosomal protein S3